MKIGILTYHRAHNYGAYLQAAALCLRLNAEPDIDCEIIDYRTRKEVDFYEKVDLIEDRKKKALLPLRHWYKKRLYSMFEREMEHPIFPMSKDCLISDSIDAFTEFVKGKYDVIIVGSDEVWKVDGFRGFPNAYWLTGDLNCRRLAFAAAAISDFDSLGKDDIKILQQAINRFSYIGLRDSVSFEHLRTFVKDRTKVHLCCDPTFLWDFHHETTRSLEEIGKVRLNPDKKTIIVMTEDWRFAHKLYQELHKKYNLVTLFKWHWGYINPADISPLEWVEMIRRADLVIATYFHAICLSIQNETPFIAVGTARRQGKISELFRTASDDLRNRYFANKEELLKDRKLAARVREFLQPVRTSEYRASQTECFSGFLEALRNEDD